MKLNRQRISRDIVCVLTFYAFLNSYFHGVDWVQTHSATSKDFAYGTAAIPELILISTLLRGRKDLKGVIGLIVPVAWTLWVNGANAAPGISGMIVALTPPIAAVLCAWFADHGVSQAAVAPSAKPGVVADGIAWLNTQKGQLTVAQIAEARGCSKTSAGKIRKAVYA